MPKRKAPLNIELHSLRNLTPKSPSCIFLKQSTYLTVFCLCLAASSWVAAAGGSEQLDWVPANQLSLAQRAELSPGCTGAYVDPRGPELLSQDLDQQPIVIEADRSTVKDENIVTLEGDVLINQGTRQLQAERIILNREANTVQLKGQVTVRQKDLLLQGREAQTQLNSRESSFNNAEFVIHSDHLRGRAQKIVQHSDRTVVLSEGKVTSCEPDSEAWLLSGREIRIDTTTHRGYGRDITLKVAGVPIFYTPFITFPVGDERQSGLLFPSIGSSDNGGVDIALPFYWNLAPNYDLTLTPRYISGRGSMLETEGRHLSQYFYHQLNLAYLADDRGDQDSDVEELIEAGLLDEENSNRYKGEDRWLGSLQQSGGAQRPWYSRIHYTRVSDEDYFRDLDTSSFDVANSTFVQQQAAVGYHWRHWHVGASASSFQNLLLDQDKRYRQLPKLIADGRYRWGLLGTELQHEYVHFDHSQKIDRSGNPIITGQRLHFDYQFYWDKRWQWGFIKPQVGVKHLRYNLDEDTLLTTARHDPSFTTPQGNLDMGLVFERYSRSFGGLTQTFEPRLFYFYSDFTDHSNLFNLTSSGSGLNFDTTDLTFSFNQLFRPERFAGHDRLEDANQVTTALTTRWSRNSTGREILRGSIGQIHYLEDRRVTLNNEADVTEESDFAAQLALTLNENFSLQTDVLYNENMDQVSRGRASLHYSDEAKVLNLGYHFVRDGNLASSTVDANADIEQVDLSFAIPMGKHWRTMARSHYDFSNRRELETFIGLEYNDCCFTVRVLARRWLDGQVADQIVDESRQYDQGLFFEFELKGLASIGTGINDILNNAIIGYRDR